jgi:hypothetical protein
MDGTVEEVGCMGNVYILWRTVALPFFSTLST